MNIADLKLTNKTKMFFAKHGYMTTESLKNENFYTLTEKKLSYSIVQAVKELNDYGFLLHADHEKTIYDYKMSKRLLNCLKNNNILYLSQLTNYTKEGILKIRNLGIASFQELQNLCMKYPAFQLALFIIATKIIFIPLLLFTPKINI